MYDLIDKNCKRCGLHTTRKCMVVGNGFLPCDILFIGEGPGRSEDIRGKPFCGESGRVLFHAFRIACSQTGCWPQWYITNTVLCHPCDYKGGPNRQPTEEEVWACRPHLEKILLKAKPIRTVFLGKVAEKFMRAQVPDGIAMLHPSYVLRGGGIGSSRHRLLVRDLIELFKEVENVKRVHPQVGTKRRKV